ncbi:ABC transporter permease, partial [Streptomyces sp. NPDC057654]
MSTVVAGPPARGGVLSGVLGSPWLSFAGRRLGRFAVSLWVVVTAAFVMIHLIPGDPVRSALGMTAPVEAVAARRHALGLDDGLLTQYWHYLRSVSVGDFGTSML